MKLPYKEFACVPRSKLKDYLLSETHIVGRSKAKLLRMLGFNEANLDSLEQGLITIAQTQEVSEIIPSQHGKKYTIDGLLYTPINKSIKVRTVWIIDKGQDKPRFVTAYPN
ncbi:MAG: DUF6883 domain-containing protein [Candidatus Scalinduaceae bacterium]